MPVSHRRLDRWPSALLAYALFGLVICFFRLDLGGVMLTEGMVAEAGRNMVESGDWIVPRLYGEPCTYKPPMAYWLAAASHAVSGGRPTAPGTRIPLPPLAGGEGHHRPTLLAGLYGQL